MFNRFRSFSSTSRFRTDTNTSQPNTTTTQQVVEKEVEGEDKDIKKDLGDGNKVEFVESGRNSIVSQASSLSSKRHKVRVKYLGFRSVNAAKKIKERFMNRRNTFYEGQLQMQKDEEKDDNEKSPGMFKGIFGHKTSKHHTDGFSASTSNLLSENLPDNNVNVDEHNFSHSISEIDEDNVEYSFTPQVTTAEDAVRDDLIYFFGCDKVLAPKLKSNSQIIEHELIDINCLAGKIVLLFMTNTVLDHKEQVLDSFGSSKTQDKVKFSEYILKFLTATAKTQPDMLVLLLSNDIFSHDFEKFIENRNFYAVPFHNVETRSTLLSHFNFDHHYLTEYQRFHHNQGSTSDVFSTSAKTDVGDDKGFLQKVFSLDFLNDELGDAAKGNTIGRTKASSSETDIEMNYLSLDKQNSSKNKSESNENNKDELSSQRSRNLEKNNHHEVKSRYGSKSSKIVVINSSREVLTDKGKQCILHNRENCVFEWKKGNPGINFLQIMTSKLLPTG